MTAKELSLIYCEVVQGFSKIDSKGGVIYFRHPSFLDIAQSEDCFDINVEKARKQDILNQEDKIKFIIEQEWWTNAKEKEIDICRQLIKGYGQDLKNTTVPSKRDKISARIQTEQEKLKTILLERLPLIGDTAEDYATRKLADYYVINNLCKDKDLTTPLFSDEAYDIISDANAKHYQDLYNVAVNKFNLRTIKCIAATTFFQNLFYSCSESGYHFYGKPTVQLSKFQSDLFIFGKNYASFIKNMDTEKVQEDIFNDPEKFVDYVDDTAKGKGKEKEMQNKGDTTQAVAHIGATKEDMKKMGIAGQVIDFVKMANESPNGILEAQQIIKARNK